MESTLTQPEDKTTNNRWRFPKLEWPFGQKAAKIHAIETRERYWILRREVEHYIDRPARELNIHDWRLEKNNNDDDSIRRHMASVEKNFRQECSALKVKREPIVDDYEVENTLSTSHECENCFRIFPRLLCYYKILLINESRLSTRNYQDLCLLLRDLNFIRTRLISDKMIQSNMLLLNQLDFCRIDARNLGKQDDPEIKAKLNQAAEEIDSSGNGIHEHESNGVTNNDKARRLIVSLMALLNDYRIKQIYNQIYKKNKYMTLCLILITLSFIIFEITPGFLNQADNNNEEVEIEQPAFTGNNKGYEEKALYSVTQLTSGPLWRIPARIIKNIFYFCVNLIASNQLYYIFFAGFTGGIFSLMMEFQPRNELPGDEIYTSWYYRTRPVIGAFGAMVMYIIIVSPAFSGSLGSIISEGIIKELTSQPLSSTGFTFGFITGFTERILLPKLI